MSKLHPIAAKFGFQTNKEFYDAFPTENHFKMAMGGENGGSKFFYQDAGPVLNNTRAQDSLKFAQSHYDFFHNVNLARDRGNEDFTRPKGPADKLEEQMNKDLIYFKNKYNSLPYEKKCHPLGWCPPNPSDPNSTEHFHKAEGGSPYIGQPTYAEFLHFGPQTKQVPFYNVGGNVDLFLRETKKSLMPAAKFGQETNAPKPLTSNGYIDERNNYMLGLIKDNTQRALLDEVHNEFANQLKYGGLPKAQNGQGMLSMYDKGMQAFKDSEAQREGELTRTIEERSSGEGRANLALAGIAGATNFFNAPENLASDEFARAHTISDEISQENKKQNRGNWGDGAQFAYNFRPRNLGYSQDRDWGIASSQYGGEQFGGMIQYDTTGSQTLPVALSGLQVKMNPGLGNSSYNGNQLAWPFHPDVMSAPAISARRDLTAVARKGANVEAEGGETVVTNFNNDGIPEHYNIKGPRHTHGGVPLSLPEDSFIFSDTAKMKIKDPKILAQFNMPPKKGGYTPAEIAKKYNINKFKKVLMDPNSDEMQIATAEKMITDYNLKLAKLALIQESMKGFPQGIPEIAKPYLAQLNIDPNMFFGGQDDEQAEQNQQVAEGEAEEADEEQMAYGGIPTARNGRARDYFNRAMYNLNPYYNMDNYNAYAYTGMYPGMYRQPSAEYHYSSNDPRASKAAMNRPEDLPDFLKYKNVQSIDYKHERPGAIKRFFGAPTVTTATYKFGPGQQPSTTNASNTKTQTNTQTNIQTQPASTSQQNAGATSPGYIDANQLPYNRPGAPGPWNSRFNDNTYGSSQPFRVQGKGVNQSLYTQPNVTKAPVGINPQTNLPYGNYGDPKSYIQDVMDDWNVPAPTQKPNIPPAPAPYPQTGLPPGNYGDPKSYPYDTGYAYGGSLPTYQGDKGGSQVSYYDLLSDPGFQESYKKGVGKLPLAQRAQMADPQQMKEIIDLIPFVGPDVSFGDWMGTAFDFGLKSLTKGFTGEYDRPGEIYKRDVDPEAFWMPVILNAAIDPTTYTGSKMIKSGVKGAGMAYGLAKQYIPELYQIAKKFGPKVYNAVKKLATNETGLNAAIAVIGNAVREQRANKAAEDKGTKEMLYPQKAKVDSTMVKTTVPRDTIYKTKQDTGVTYTVNDIKKLVGQPGYEGYSLQELLDHYKGQGYNIK